jgi:hypothetical protein
MKPLAWDTMTDEDRRQMAVKFLGTTRGSYIIGQALALAKRALRAKQYPEESNAQDMEILQTLFFPYETVEFEATHMAREAQAEQE